MVGLGKNIYIYNKLLASTIFATTIEKKFLLALLQHIYCFDCYCVAPDFSCNKPIYGFETGVQNQKEDKKYTTVRKLRCDLVRQV